MNNITMLKAGLFGLAVFCTALPANAFSVLQPGFTTGLPLYAVFPQGVYLINVLQYGERNSTPESDLFSEAPFFFYQSPFVIAGAHINMQFAPSYAVTRVGGAAAKQGFYNTYFGIGGSWDLGNGWYIGNRFAGWIPQKGPEAYDFGDFETRLGVTYLKNGVNFTVNAVLGFPVPSGYKTAPNAFNLDTTLSKRIPGYAHSSASFCGCIRT
jgi:hypothetical protein